MTVHQKTVCQTYAKRQPVLMELRIKMKPILIVVAHLVEHANPNKLA